MITGPPAAGGEAAAADAEAEAAGAGEGLDAGAAVAAALQAATSPATETMAAAIRALERIGHLVRIRPCRHRVGSRLPCVTWYVIHERPDFAATGAVRGRTRGPGGDLPEVHVRVVAEGSGHRARRPKRLSRIPLADQPRRASEPVGKQRCEGDREHREPEDG